MKRDLLIADSDVTEWPETPTVSAGTIWAFQRLLQNSSTGASTLTFILPVYLSQPHRSSGFQVSDEFKPNPERVCERLGEEEWRNLEKWFIQMNAIKTKSKLTSTISSPRQQILGGGNAGTTG
ncbi:hypothetical protein J6590_032826 [Homalodisca vitripennis]|nr:hypothetical protein J6590_032826 [Homalodisca vitripennis]